MKFFMKTKNNVAVAITNMHSPLPFQTVRDYNKKYEATVQNGTNFNKTSNTRSNRIKKNK